MQIAGRHLETGWWGDPGSPRLPLVLLHEGLGSLAQWREVPEALAIASGRRVLAYSRFAHGQSDPPAVPHTVHFMHDEARLLPAVLDAAGIARAVLLGHSDGGSIALICAAEHPERVAALILEAPHVFVEDLSIASIRRTTAAYQTTDLRERLARYHRHVDVAFYGWSDVWLDPAFRTWNLESLLPRIACPVLAIQGEQDEYGTLRQVEAIAAGVAGRCERLVLPACGHAPHRDQREATVAAISAFLRALP